MSAKGNTRRGQGGQKRKLESIEIIESCESNNAQQQSKPSESDIDWRQSNKSLVSGMAHSFETGLYSDVLFKVGPKGIIVNAHKSILMVRSEVFARMLNERWNPTDPNDERRVVSIPEHNPITFKLFLKYLHTDIYPSDVKVEDHLEILKLSHLYQVPGLIVKCSRNIKRLFKIESCVEIYLRTKIYTELDLSARALEFIENHISSVASTEQFLHFDVKMLENVVKSDEIDINEVELFKALIRWGNVEGQIKDLNGEDKPRKEVMLSLINYIRFLLISPQDFAKYVAPTKVLSDAQAYDVLCTSLTGDKMKNEQMERWSKPRSKSKQQTHVPAGISPRIRKKRLRPWNFSDDFSDD